MSTKHVNKKHLSIFFIIKMLLISYLFAACIEKSNPLLDYDVFELVIEKQINDLVAIKYWFYFWIYMSDHILN